MQNRVLLGRRPVPLHGNPLTYSMLLEQTKSSLGMKMPPVMGCQIITKRHFFYQYFTKDKKSYEEFRKRVKPGLRWDKEGLGPNKTMSAWKYSHEDDPTAWGIMDKEYMGSPRFGDPNYQYEWYRTYPTHWYEHRPFLDRFFGKIAAAFFWFWLFYHLYWNNGMLFGHYYIPLTKEFTDEELGIPPDDAPDPTPDQCWSQHDMPYNTYR